MFLLGRDGLSRPAEPGGLVRRLTGMWLIHRINRRRLADRAIVLAGCVSASALTVAGCASATAPGGSPGASLARTGSAATVAASTGPATPAAGTRPQRAAAEAARMLTAFVAPPGARRVATAPVAPIAFSQSPPGGPEDDDIVNRSAYWLVPGATAGLLNWEAAHIHPPYHRDGDAVLGNQLSSNDYPLAAVPGLFDYRQLTVTAAPAGPGRTAVRVDATVDWIPARRPGDTVPATAKVAVLTLTKGTGGTPPVIASTTLTAPQRVRKLAAYLNGLPLSVPGASYGCPAGSVKYGGGLTAVFRARPGGPVLAKATADLTGCAFLTYTMPGQPEVGLNGGDAGLGLLAEVNHVTGLHWKVP